MYKIGHIYIEHKHVEMIRAFLEGGESPITSPCRSSKSPRTRQRLVKYLSFRNYQVLSVNPHYVIMLTSGKRLDMGCCNLTWYAPQHIPCDCAISLGFVPSETQNPKPESQLHFCCVRCGLGCFRACCVPPGVKTKAVIFKPGAQTPHPLVL